MKKEDEEFAVGMESTATTVNNEELDALKARIAELEKENKSLEQKLEDTENYRSLYFNWWQKADTKNKSLESAALNISSALKTYAEIINTK